MSSASEWFAAWRLLGPLALQIALIVGFAALFQRFVVSGHWRRIVWQTGLIGTLLAALGEVSGVLDTPRQWLDRDTPVPSVPSTTMTAQTGVPEGPTEPDPARIIEGFRREVNATIVRKQIAEPEADADVPGDPAGTTGSLPAAATAWSAAVETIDKPRTGHSSASTKDVTEFPLASWLALVWIVGTCVFTLRMGLCRLVFFLFHRRFRPLENAALKARVAALAKQVGIRGTVHLRESQRLTGPVAFGWFSLTIALPSDFQEFHPAQQNAMLAHELAHLAAGDSAWQNVSDCAASLLWWHPLVWWMRRQLLSAAEAAADDASLLVENGPSALAECLVALGGRLSKARPAGWVGIEGNGFRSGLARRVTRLITLQGGSWQPPRLLWTWFTKAIGPIGLAALAVAGTAWARPSENEKDQSMKTLHNSLWQTLSTLALVSAIASDPETSSAQQTPESPGTMDQVLRKRYGLPSPAVASEPPPAPRNTISASSSAQNARSKLSQTVLDELFYDGILLSEVLEDLSRESLENDPEKLGLNFLISNTNPATMEAYPEPAVLLSVGTPQPTIDVRKVQIQFNAPLRRIRMKDALDAIVAVADHPIRYSIENYGVVFSPGRATREERTREEDRNSRFRMDPEMLRRYGLLPRESDPERAARAMENNRSRIQSKLDQIVLPELFYEGISFPEVVKDLDDRVKTQDPEKEGLSFVFNPTSKVVPAPSTQFDAQSNQPIRVSKSDPIDLSGVLVNFSLPLRNVRLRDALDAIVRVADSPIEYSVENYGVLFAIRSPADLASRLADLTRRQARTTTSTAGTGTRFPVPRTTLEVRTFRVDTNTFTRGLEGALGIRVADHPKEPSLLDTQRTQTALRLAERELADLELKHSVGTADTADLEKARANVDLLNASSELERAEIRLRLADSQLTQLEGKFKGGRASSLDIARAQAARDMLNLDLQALQEEDPLIPSRNNRSGEGGSKTAGLPLDASSQSIQDALRKLLTQLGVTGLNTESGAGETPSVNQITPDPGGRKTVFYNAFTGIVLIRAAPDDMPIVEAAMETLGSLPQARSSGSDPTETALANDPFGNQQDDDSRFSLRGVSVLGAVQKPGVFDILPNTRMDIMEAIARAGGFGPKANKNKIELTHKGKAITFKFDELRKVVDPDEKVWLEPGDLIYVPESVF